MHVNVYIYICVCSIYASTPHEMKHNAINGNQTKWFKTTNCYEIITNIY